MAEDIYGLIRKYPDDSVDEIKGRVQMICMEIFNNMHDKHLGGTDIKKVRIEDMISHSETGKFYVRPEKSDVAPQEVH